MDLKFDLIGGWWFSAAFAFVNLLFVLSSSRARIKRLMRFPKFTSKFERIISYISVILYTRGLIILTVFIPIRFHWVSFTIGTSLYIVCLILYSIAMCNFLSADHDEPVTTGIYARLRHPMQVLAVVMWIGVGIACLSWLILAACIIQFFISYPFLVAQERECITMYGDRYQEYMKSVNRYLIR
jgi:protein-S-isoprenylcysteine O-methyltransferase Ste14